MFKNWTVGFKLTSGFLSVSFIGAIVAIIGTINMERINGMAERMYEQELLGLSYIKEANINLIYAGRARGNVLLSTTAEEREKNKANLKKYLAAVKENVDKAKPLFVTEKAKALFSREEKNMEIYEKLNEKTVALASAEKLQEINEELKKALADTRQSADDLDELLRATLNKPPISGFTSA